MTFQAIARHKRFAPALGAVLAALCGLALWAMPLGVAWRNASYDELFRFGARSITNNVVLILLDNDAYADNQLGQVRTQSWSRALHTKLLTKLAADSCPLVVFDVFFGTRGNPDEDKALAEAMRQQRQIVLGAKLPDLNESILTGIQTNLPEARFLAASHTNWGIAKANTNEVDHVVRRHWPAPPFDSPGSPPPPTLPWTAARLAGAPLGKTNQERWLRYHGTGRSAAWTYLSYADALSMDPHYFGDKIVFIGNEPASPAPDGEPDKFRTPYTWSPHPESVGGGVEILATEFLNLWNGDWLRRPPGWVEVLVLLTMGGLLGASFCQVRLWVACVAGAGVFLAVILGAACLSYFTDFWFPWLIVAGGQLPVALGAAFAKVLFRSPSQVSTQIVEPPDYERFGPPFGEGGFGKVWIVRNAIGQWQALKEVYKANFGDDSGKFEMEFNGIQKYKPISHKHPGLLRIEFVSREKRAGFFYYVMELGDPLDPDNGWEEQPALFKPRDLRNACARAERNRLPVRECAEIGLKLAEALEFLHREGLTHRDIKPGNVIFVNGQPKLADAGTVTVLRPPEQIHTHVGSRGYTPPGEPPGTRQADIFSLGKLLYRISTGRDPENDFPALPTTLVEHTGPMDFMGLNRVIVKACHPDLGRRYGSAEEMRVDLLELLNELKLPGC